MAEIVLNVNFNDKNALTGIRNLKKQLSKLSDEFNKINVNEGLTKQLNALAKALNAATKSAKESSDGINKHNQSLKKAENAVYSLQKRYQNLIKTIKSTREKYPSGTFDDLFGDVDKYAREMDSLFKSVKEGKPITDEQIEQIIELRTEYEKLSALLPKVENENQKNIDGINKHNQSLISMLPNILKWQVAMTAVMAPLRMLQNGWASLNETLVKTEDTIIDIQRVLSGKVSGGEISDTIYDLAIQYGQTFENVSEIVENFVKTGLDWSDAVNATKAALLALNVAELDSEQASEGLIAIMAQFKIQASELTNTIDLLNKAADTNAVTTEELLVALQKTGSYAKQANLSLADTVAIITRLSEATAASGPNLGNAVKSLLAYTTKDSSLNLYASISDEMSQTVAEFKQGKLTILDVWKALSQELQGMDESKKEMLAADAISGGLEDELSEWLEDTYDEIADIYGTAGTYRKNYFIALMNNLEDVDKLIEDISDSAGYSAEENEKYLASYTAKVKSLQAQWQKLANDQQGLLAIKKILVDIGSAILTFVDNTNALSFVLKEIAVIVSLALGKSAILGVQNLIKAFKEGAIQAKLFGSAVNTAFGIIGLVATVVMAVVTGIQAYNKEQQRLRDETISTWKAEKEQANQLYNLYEQYKNLTKEDEEFKNVESEIVALLGEKGKALSVLSKGTNEYAEAVKKLTEKELAKYRQDATRAKMAAEQNVLGFLSKEHLYLETPRGSRAGAEDFYKRYLELIEERDRADEAYRRAQLYGTEKEISQAKNEWIKYYDLVEKLAPVMEEYADSLNYLAELEKIVSGETENTAQSVEKINKTLSKISDNIKDKLILRIKEMRDVERESYEWEEKKLAVLEAQNALYAAQSDLSVRVLDESGQWTRIADERAIEKARENLQKAQYELQQASYDKIIGLLEKGTTNSEVINLLDEITGVFGDATFSNDIETLIKDVTGVDLKSITEDVDAYLNSLFGEDGAIKNVLDTGLLTEADIALMKKTARDSLLDAGGIDNAIENLFGESGSVTKILNDVDLTEDEKKTLKDNLDEFYKSAINAITGNIEKDITDSLPSAGKSPIDSSIRRENLGSSAGTTVPETAEKKSLWDSIVDGVSSWWNNFVEVAGRIGSRGTMYYDQGGILNGLGGIKATSEPETVLDPELTRQILSPTANSNFSNFAKSLGILFGASNQIASTSGYTNNSFGTNNTYNNGNSYNVNGVTISKEVAERTTVAELLELAAFNQAY